MPFGPGSALLTLATWCKTFTANYVGRKLTPSTTGSGDVRRQTLFPQGSSWPSRKSWV